MINVMCCLPRIRRVAIRLAILAVSLFGLSSVVQAAELLPNPGFESTCNNGLTNVPCFWTARVGTIGVDPAHHAGSQSMSVTSPSSTPAIKTSIDADAQSDCMTTGVIAGGDHKLSFWYRAPATATLSSLFYTILFFSSPTCAAGLETGSQSMQFTPIRDGAWHQVTSTAAAPLLSLSAQIDLGQMGSAPLTTVFFDDVSFQSSSPTAVTLTSFNAASTASGVRVSWQTAAEIDTVGFNVYRTGQDGAWQKINAALIPATGASDLNGSSYAVDDPTARAGQTYSYKLQMIDANGHVEWAGPITITVSRPAVRAPR